MFWASASHFLVVGSGLRVQGLGCWKGFRVQSSEIRVQSSGFGGRISDFGFWVSGSSSWSRVKGAGFWGRDSGYRVLNIGLQVSGFGYSGFMVLIFGFRVWGVG